MFFRFACLTAVSVCLAAGSDQTLMPGFGGQTAEDGQAMLMRALKANSLDALGFGQPNYPWQAGPNDTANFFPALLGPEYGKLLGRVELPGSMTHCSIPLTPMPIKPTLDSISPKTPPKAIDKNIAVPPPVPACTAR